MAEGAPGYKVNEGRHVGVFRRSGAPSLLISDAALGKIQARYNKTGDVSGTDVEALIEDVRATFEDRLRKQLERGGKDKEFARTLGEQLLSEAYRGWQEIEQQKAALPPKPFIGKDKLADERKALQNREHEWERRHKFPLAGDKGGRELIWNLYSALRLIDSNRAGIQSYLQQEVAKRETKRRIQAGEDHDS